MKKGSWDVIRLLRNNLMPPSGSIIGVSHCYVGDGFRIRHGKEYNNNNSKNNNNNPENDVGHDNGDGNDVSHRSGRGSKVYMINLRTKTCF